LGYVPKGLAKILKQLILPKENKKTNTGKKEKREKKTANLIKKIQKVIIKEAFNIWTTRNKEWDVVAKEGKLKEQN
jgi:hypothetical protein